MSIKIHNPKNPILLEGLWGLGKTRFSKAYCAKYGYILKPEPLHTLNKRLEEIKDIDKWYIKEHILRQDFLENTIPSLVERSILSTFAFLYALERPLPDPALIWSLKETLEKNAVLTVYLRAETDAPFWKEEDLRNHSSDIQNIIFNDRARRRYDEWFTKILPHEYGILPLILRVTEKGLRRTTDEMIKDVYLVLACNRTAQVNAVCFTRDPSKKDVQILVLKRNAQKGGFWQTITGGVRPSEDPLRAVQREIQEETSIINDSSNIFWTDITYSFLGDDNYILDEYVFGAEIKDPLKFSISEEHSASEWLSPKEARQRVEFDNNKKAIDEVCKKIEQSN